MVVVAVLAMAFQFGYMADMARHSCPRPPRRKNEPNIRQRWRCAVKFLRPCSRPGSELGPGGGIDVKFQASGVAASK